MNLLDLGTPRAECNALKKWDFLQRPSERIEVFKQIYDIGPPTLINRILAQIVKYSAKTPFQLSEVVRFPSRDVIQDMHERIKDWFNESA